jgi:hypothetical protein
MLLIIQNSPKFLINLASIPEILLYQIKITSHWLLRKLLNSFISLITNFVSFCLISSLAKDTIDYIFVMNFTQKKDFDIEYNNSSSSKFIELQSSYLTLVIKYISHYLNVILALLIHFFCNYNLNSSMAHY